MSTPGAKRVRLHRERRRRGARIIRVEIDVDLLELLADLGLVGPDTADDSSVLNFAILMLLTEAAEARLKRNALQAAPGL